MSLKLEDVKGLGKKTVDILKKEGIDTVEKLANSELEDLANIKGIGKTSAQKYVMNAKTLLKAKSKDSDTKTEIEEEEVQETETEEKDEEEEKKLQEELKKLEEKKKNLQDKKVENGDFILLKITGRTQQGDIFRVSSEADARKAGIYNEEKAQQGYYTPEFVVVGKPGFINEGLTEAVKEMKYFEKKSIRVPPTKAFGKREPGKIERISIGKFTKLNEGKNPEIGKEYRNKKGQSGVITNIVQGRVIIDYNHPLAGHSIDYNLEIIDKIEEFDEKIKYFMTSKGIPKNNVSEFKINYIKEDKTIEITIPKMFLFQNLTYVKFGLAMDLQTNMADEIEDVKFIEIYEKIQIPTTPADSVMQKVEKYNKEHDENDNQS